MRVNQLVGRVVLPVFATLLLSGLVLAQDAAELPSPVQGAEATASYGIGLQMGRQLAQGGFDGSVLDADALAKGISDSLAGSKPQITQEQFQAAMQQIQQTMRAKLQAAAAANLKQGQAFLTKYADVDGVKKLPSGLMYRVIQAGNGESPKATDQVKTHYRGRLINKKVFDSSYDRGEPATFALNQVIPGWSEALQQMQPGAQWQLVIPPDLAYGERGSPPAIPPNSVLIFDIELIEVLGPAPDPGIGGLPE